MKYLLLLVFFFTIKAYPSEYPHYTKQEKVNRGLKAADIIFYGELIKVDTILGTYDFKILEIFKGHYHSKFIKATNNEKDFFIAPFKNDLWIVYAKFNKDRTISLNLRSPTQTMEIPSGFPPPIPYYNTYGRKITKLDSLSNDIENLKIRNETLTTFFYQLDQLKSYKASQNTNSEKEKSEQKIETYSRYIIISLIVNIILFLILIFVISKKKNTNL
ncbi:hypothetical protein [Flavobacterium sp. N1736]|uniref:hypothetical protein n=1 Tax=Flavobacterium sp. N1736 TaxID=2986823 RepID=UPI0022245214|nr:hypothetical protein [Flavobacterium sp. N1736]